jgi:hypothetical protein
MMLQSFSVAVFSHRRGILGIWIPNKIINKGRMENSFACVFERIWKQIRIDGMMLQSLVVAVGRHGLQRNCQGINQCCIV